jgi:hypothetical protein
MTLPLRAIDVAAPAVIAGEVVLVLSRPDQHVAWRGHGAPADPLARVRGAAG